LGPGAVVGRALPAAVGLVAAASEALHLDLFLGALRIGGHRPADTGLEPPAAAGAEQHRQSEENQRRTAHAVAASSGTSTPSWASSRCRAPSATGAFTSPC